MDHNQTFEKYNEIMVLASSKRQTLDSISNKDLEAINEFLNFQINQIDSLLDEIDYLISNYQNLEVEIEPHELNEMEHDLNNLRKDYVEFSKNLEI
ncbi:hypothetical protein [Methanobacterium alcaliphilum]|uniref:hypothetical protein n=1 Tax=Methanobacterium alcaliphilum TaxID=392018 RepID=UPI00200B0BBF|nr:hypothetical protein [Methanobacterium alcaliphilum]MCK9151178.1 hypothetical protein [Methanobacterium alcaliphilum]